MKSAMPSARKFFHPPQLLAVLKALAFARLTKEAMEEIVQFSHKISCINS